MAKSKTNSKKGSISVDTQSLFPIIKKWLYSERDIFLRELVSNAHDAILKLERLSDMGEYKGKVANGLINIKIDKTKKQLVFSDNGLGMNDEEIEKYINQIAFSGAREFLEKYEKSNDNKQIIGHFGMGFFSSFMVSRLVEIDSLSFKEGAKPVHWSCDGSTQYEMKEGQRTEIGTDVILHLNEESEIYLDETKIKELVRKYSNYLGIEIQVNGVKANEKGSIWNEASKNLKEEDYKKLYNELFPYESDPLFHVHFNIDYPFNLKGIIYFPRYRSDFDPTKKGRIQLYCNNIFVSDNIIDIIPNYLNLLQGVIDSPDIPLNVSRSALQTDVNVAKMGKYIAGKVLDQLSSILKNDRKKYEEYWKDIHTFVKFGCLSDEDFSKRMNDSVLFKNIKGDFLSVQEYLQANEKLKNKVLYVSDLSKQSVYIEECKKRGLDALVLAHPLDNHFIQQSEYKNADIKFFRVDSQPIDTLLNETLEEEANPTKKNLEESIKKALEDNHLDIKIKSLKNTNSLLLLTQSEQMRRFSEMSKMTSNPLDSHESFPETIGISLYLNSSHPLFSKLEELSQNEAEKEKYEKFLKSLYKLAKLKSGLLIGQELSEFSEELEKSMEDNL